MFWTVLLRYFSALVLAGTLGLTVNFLIDSSAQAQPRGSIPSSSSNQALKSTWDAFQPPNRGVPGRREGGGTRGPLSCPSGANKLTALIPTSTLGRTASDQPSLLYYVPAVLDQIPVQLEITDESEKVIYTTSFKLSNDQPGIVQLSLADKSDAPDLKADQKYHWYLTIRCEPDSADASSDITVHGWIERVDLPTSEADQLAQMPPRDRLAIYQQEGLWYDMLSTLARLRAESPDDAAVEQQWSDLLKSVGLEKVTEEPLVSTQLIPGS
ncbi:MAG: DUF928 domain-containing protein [Oscillatoriales cyanobacterium RM2_1_1]|nr:DUF928 domain-containing protein [Oscillatoriales cyanobacterium SM2_3_0]NJO45596.1 DUF928 domain-containing protein [Oscillatoriales cyanobacterium RM2_1_1]